MDILLFVPFVIVCLLLIGVILLQKGRGGGLGAAFGGAGSSAFGTRTGDVLTWVTIVLTSLFLLLSVVTVLAFKPAQKAVNQPSLIPPPGPIDSPVMVSIQRNQKNATIYYTTDLSDPNEKSTVYDGGSITINPGQTIKARNLFAGRWSDVTIGAYPMKSPTTFPATEPGTQPGTLPATAPAATEPAEQTPATMPG